MVKEQMELERSNATQDMSKLKDILGECGKLTYSISKSLGIPLPVSPNSGPTEPREGIVPDIECCLIRARVIRDELQFFVTALGENCDK